MRSVAVFLSDELTVRRLTLAFRNRCVVQVCTDMDQLRDDVAAGIVVAFIVDMQGDESLPAGSMTPVELIARLHLTYAAVPIVGYVDFTPERARDILAAAHAGATEIILREYDNLDHIATRIVDLGVVSEVTARVGQVIVGIVPEPLREFFLSSVLNATTNATVEQITSRLHRNRKTLANWLAAAHLPPPFRIVGWARVLLAARMLDMPSRSTEKVARELRFMSGVALRNMMRRYIGCGPDRLRQLGGFEYALQVFADSLRASQRML